MLVELVFCVGEVDVIVVVWIEVDDVEWIVD